MVEYPLLTVAAPRKAAAVTPPLPFAVPPELAADAPAEARGLGRDQVRLMVSYMGANRIEHAIFRQLPRFLAAGDVLVINTSGTMNAAVPARRRDGARLLLHLSTRLPSGLWSVEVRRPAGGASEPYTGAAAGDTLVLPAGGQVTLLTPYRSGRGPQESGPARLWVASLHVPQPLEAYLAAHGRPIRYPYVSARWPSDHYQTVYATETGSAEMPSAGRAFTPALITRLVAAGVQIVPLILHTGVASLEAHEPPYAEAYRVPPTTARAVGRARQDGHRVIAVGTTVVRALETVTDAAGQTHAGQGWTELVLAPPRRLRAVDGLLTGFHEPRASHLEMLAALAGRPHLELTYAAALRRRYRWHEFGDLHLLLP